MEITREDVVTTEAEEKSSSVGEIYICTDDVHSELGDSIEESPQNYLPVTSLATVQNIKRCNCSAFNNKIL